MHGVATKKVIGGKLLRVKTQFDKVVESVQLTGDFFLYPEESVGKIEESLVGIPVASAAHIFLEGIRKSVSENAIELVGIAPEDITETLIASLHPQS